MSRPLKLTRHGRRRFHKRVGYMSDEEIKTYVLFQKYVSLPNKRFKFIREPVKCKKGGLKNLVTVLRRRPNNRPS